MVDVLGPGDAGASPVLTTTTDVQNPASGDTFLENCVANVPGTGTPYVQKWGNRLLQQMRRIIRLSGMPLSGYLDDLLGLALQACGLTWMGTIGGTGNAWTATFSPAPATLVAGMRSAGIISAANTGAITKNSNSLGNIAVTRSDGAAFVGGEFAVGQVVEDVYDGTAWRVTSVPPSNQRPTICNVGIAANFGLANTVATTVTNLTGTSTADVTVAAAALTIVNSGDYHIDLVCQVDILTNAAGTYNASARIFRNSTPIGLAGGILLASANGANTWPTYCTYSRSLPLVAGDVLTLVVEATTSAYNGAEVNAGNCFIDVERTD
jgi:hypothetical protein